MENHDILIAELKGSLDFYLKWTNLDPNSPGFGLTVDSTKNPSSPLSPLPDLR